MRACEQAAASNSRQRQRDQHVVARERYAEKAPRRLVAGYDMDRIQLVDQRSAAVEIGEWASAVARSRPKAPLNAGVIGAERRADQPRHRQHGKTASNKEARRVISRGDREHERERDHNIIRNALDEAEMAGLVVEHELEVPGARKRREAEHK